jgi:hypothetical protein
LALVAALLRVAWAGAAQASRKAIDAPDRSAARNNLTADQADAGRLGMFSVKVSNAPSKRSIPSPRDEGS